FLNRIGIPLLKSGCILPQFRGLSWCAGRETAALGHQTCSVLRTGSKYLTDDEADARNPVAETIAEAELRQVDLLPLLPGERRPGAERKADLRLLVGARRGRRLRVRDRGRRRALVLEETSVDD